jgi:hypothetical protein
VLDFASEDEEVAAVAEVVDVVAPLEAESLPPPQETKAQRISAEKKRPSDLMRVLINEFIAV